MITITLMIIVFELATIAYLLTLSPKEKPDVIEIVDKVKRNLKAYPKYSKRKPIVNDDLKSYKVENGL